MKTHWILAGVSWMLLLACNPQAGGEAPVGAASSSVEATRGAPAGWTKEGRRQRLRVLGEGERGVAFIVLPGDANVEVDGGDAARRDGVVDRVGKVGDQRRVRVWKGDKSTG